MNQDVHVLAMLLTVCINEQWNNMKLFAHLSAKTRLPKQDHLESSVCPCETLTIVLWQDCFRNGYHACILLWKRFTIYPRNLSCQSSYFRWKLIDKFFSAVSAEIKKIAEIRAGSLSCLAASPLNFARTCAPTWACSIRAFTMFSFHGRSFHNVFVIAYTPLWFPFLTASSAFLVSGFAHSLLSVLKLLFTCLSFSLYSVFLLSLIQSDLVSSTFFNFFFHQFVPTLHLIQE